MCGWISFVPAAFQHCVRKTGEPGITYQVSDIVGGTDLIVCMLILNQLQVSSTHYVTHVISFTRLPHFYIQCLKLGGAWVQGYRWMILWPFITIFPRDIIFAWTVNSFTLTTRVQVMPNMVDKTVLFVFDTIRSRQRPMEYKFLAYKIIAWLPLQSSYLPADTVFISTGTIIL